MHIKTKWCRLVPDGVREEAQAPGQTRLLPQAESSYCTLKGYWNGPIPKMEFTEGHFSCLHWVKQKEMHILFMQISLCGDMHCGVHRSRVS